MQASHVLTPGGLGCHTILHSRYYKLIIYYPTTWSLSTVDDWSIVSHLSRNTAPVAPVSNIGLSST